MRTCARCGDPSTGSWCQPCKKAYNRSYHEANKAKANGRSRQWAIDNRDHATALSKAWQAKNPEKTRASKRATHLRRTFNLTLEEYDELLAAQGGGCAICHDPCSTGRNLAVDHCHTSGDIRGLLCAACNHTLGKMRESPALLRAAADYLELSMFADRGEDRH